MSWTNIPNANLAIGAPIRSIDQLALRDNPIAIAEGATGAPRVRAEALNGGQSGSAPIFAARAWVNFDGTTAGANPAPMTIRASGNVSSVTRNAAGDYTVNFTTAMVDDNYAVNITSGGSVGSTTETLTAVQSTTVSAARVITKGISTFVNRAEVHVAIFR
jgi:hypothetical protein